MGAKKKDKKEKKDKGGSRPGTAGSGGGMGLSGGGDVDYKKLADDLDGEVRAQIKQRNYFQLERDKINAFWEISKKEVSNLRAELRNKEREAEELEERHQVEMKVYKQKVRHLLYEHKITIDRLKGENENTAKLRLDDHRAKEYELKKDKRALREELKNSELEHEEKIKTLRDMNDKNLTKMRQELERALKELQFKYEKKMKNLRDELELRRKAEVHEIEERKNEHIKELMTKHKKAFEDIKDYYNDITTNNLDLIKQLKEEVSNMKKNETHNEKLMFEIAQENKRLSEPLTKALKEVNQLRHELANYEKDKLSLKNSKARLLLLEDELKNLRWEHEVLEQRFQHVQTERDDIYQKYESTIHHVAQKNNFKTLLLEKKLSLVNDKLQEKDNQLNQVLQQNVAQN